MNNKMKVQGVGTDIFCSFIVNKLELNAFLEQWEVEA